jgi:hypothetical protein
MPKFHVSKTIEIDAPIASVYPLIRNFRAWPQWSPWLIAEPQCELTFGTDGLSYGWDGKIVGKGEMKLLSEAEHESIHYELTFLKPFKSVNATAFEFAYQSGKTTVKWTMTGSLPFFMFFMKKMMEAWIGMDYQRGLHMLKDLVETGSVPCTLNWPGVRIHEGHDYVGIRTRCSIDDIGTSMEADFNALGNYCAELTLAEGHKPFSIYHKWDLLKGICEYTSGVPVSEIPATLKEGFISGTHPEMDVYPIEMTGAYHHLGNAWSVGMMHARAKCFKQSKRLHPFEVYETMPGEVQESDLRTTICFPVA